MLMQIYDLQELNPPVKNNVKQKSVINKENYNQNMYNTTF